MDDQAFPRPIETPQRKRPKAIIVLVLFLLILGGVLVAGSFFLGAQDDQSEDEDVVPTAVIEPTDEPTPSPEEEGEDADDEETDPTNTPAPTSSTTGSAVDRATGLDRSTLRIQVLNGSGTQGAASEMATFLRDLGYSVTSTGNADNFDYEDVTIQLRSTKSNFESLLEKDLAGDYTISETTTNLASDSSDAVIIVGS